MLQAELIIHLRRWRSIGAFAAAITVPVVAAVATSSGAGKRNGSEVGLYGTATFSALNHAAASLQFTAPLLLGIIVAMLGAAIGAADREWGYRRYLYVQPVSPRRLVTAKAAALATSCLITTLAVIGSGIASGVAAFGWHGFHRLDGPTLPPIEALLRLVEASGYVTLSLMFVASVAFTLAAILPGPAEALAVTTVFLVVSRIADGLPAFNAVNTWLPTHYSERWTELLTGNHHGLAVGAAIQTAGCFATLTIGYFAHQRNSAID
jgi:ABC-2 type transport system permease protein